MCFSIALGVSDNPSTALPHVPSGRLTGRTPAEMRAYSACSPGLERATRNDRRRRYVSLAPPTPVRVTHTTSVDECPIIGTPRARSSARGLHEPHVDGVSASSGELVGFCAHGEASGRSRPPTLGRDATTSVLAPSYCSASSLP